MRDADSDSDYSDSSESISSTKSSSASSFECGATELAEINDVSFRLPKCLCENRSVFREFFSMNTWRDLPDNFQAYLKNKFLPHFPTNNEIEQETTLKMLFNGEIKRFDVSPMDKFQSVLEEGGYRPDVLKLRMSIDRSRRRERRYQECERVSQMAKSLMISREKLLRAAYDSPPGGIPKAETILAKCPPLNQSNAAIRAQKRFFDEISHIVDSIGLAESSDEENLIESSAMDTTPSHDNQTTPSNENKIVGTMCRKNSTRRFATKALINDSNLREILCAHKKRKLEEPDRPEYETNDIRLRDVHARTQISGNYRKFHSKTIRKKISLKSKQKKGAVDPIFNAGSVSNDEACLPNAEYPAEPEIPKRIEEKPCVKSSDNEEESPVKVDTLPPAYLQNSNDDTKKKPKLSMPNVRVARKVISNTSEATSPEKISNEVTVVDTPPSSHQPQVAPSASPFPQYHGKIKAATVSDLEGIDMMRLPVDLDEEGHISLLKGPNDSKMSSDGSELMQDTHVCFFSLIRDIFCSTSNHRIKLEDLTEKVCAWLSNPITALNDWYSNADNWLTLIPSAIHFLAGDFTDQPEDFVPYLEFKTHLDIYQWIGAGRDSDQHLLQLYNYWLSRRHEMGSKPIHKHEQCTRKSTDIEDILLNEKPISPPPPKCPTSWIVQPYTSDEIAEFRIQEKQRFENPHRAFTYRMHGYESVVGPVKGIYTQIFALTKARGHNMLIADRPNFVTILTLVRDATARLPNGEGTRADICELLKSSQYINPQAQDSILQTIVSGALDRMHTEHDPCVRYDPKRKIWIYLHRNRTEEEFERLHQQYQGVGKHKKTANRKLKQKMTNVSGSEDAVAITSITSNVATPKLLPTLSSIQQPSPQPVLANSANHISLKISPKSQIKPELVPIKAATINPEKHESQDSNTPKEGRPVSTLLQRAQNFQMLPTLVVDANAQKFAPRRTVLQNTPILSSPLTVASNPTIVQSTASPLPNNNFDPKSLTSPLTTPSPGQSFAGVKAQQTMPEKKIVKQISVSENSVTPNVVTSSTQGFVIPINLNNSDKVKHTITTTVATLTSINSKPKVNQAQGLVHSTTIKQPNKSFLRVSSTTAQAGKSLISPHVAVTNITLQQQQKLLSNINSPNAAAQQRVGQVNLTPGRTQQKATLVNNTKTPHHIALFNQKQNIQSIIPAGNNKTIQRQNTINLQNAVMIPSSQISQTGLQGKQVIISSQGGVPQLQKVVITSGNSSIPSTTITATPSNVVTSHTVGTSLINPQIIRIQQTGQLAGAKLQTINASNITQQDQSLFQGMKKQQQKIQQGQPSNQSLIIKQQPVFQQIQKQGGLSTSPVVSTTILGSNTAKTITTAALAATVRDSSNATVNQTFIPQQAINNAKNEATMPQTSVGKPTQTVTRVIKSGGTIMQPHTLTNVPGIRTQAGSPVMAKVVANNPGQIISLESLLQKQSTSATLRIAGTKTNQANVLQLGAPGTQMAQYAVVSQGRNIISVAAPHRMVATPVSNAGTIVTSLASVTGTKLGEQTITALNTGTSQAQTQNTSKVITTNQIHSIAAQQFMNAKVLSKTASGGIRMVNASNLNIAHIRGKPVIIASKPTNVSGQQGNQSVILQNAMNSTPVVIGAQTLKLQGNVLAPANVQVLSQSSSAPSQTVVLGNQIIKVQQAVPLKSQNTTPVSNIISNTISSVNSNAPHLGTLSVTNSSNSNLSTIGPKTVVLGSTGQTLRVQPSTNVNVQTACSSSQAQPLLLGTAVKGATVKGTNTGQQRVVLAVQGGGQIILPPGFQGGAINLKSMQGLKVVSVTQQQNKDECNDRPSIFAQMMPTQRSPNSGGE